MDYRVKTGDETLTVNVTEAAPGSFLVRIGEHTHSVSVQTLGHAHHTLCVDGAVFLLERGGGQPRLDGESYDASIEGDVEATSGRRRQTGDGTLRCPMPGRVLRLLVASGDVVQADTPLVVVEAMKMENLLFAPHGGRVNAIFVAPGDTVEAGSSLLSVVPE